MDINPDSERSSYLSASLWGPCSIDMVLLEVGPPSSISSFKVDGGPGHKHNYISCGLHFKTSYAPPQMIYTTLSLSDPEKITERAGTRIWSGF
jgi:hypothetical protein